MALSLLLAAPFNAVALWLLVRATAGTKDADWARWNVIFASSSGLLVLALNLVSAFGAVGGESVDPSQRATISASSSTSPVPASIVAVLGLVLPVLATIRLRR